MSRRVEGKHKLKDNGDTAVEKRRRDKEAFGVPVSLMASLRSV